MGVAKVKRCSILLERECLAPNEETSGAYSGVGEESFPFWF